MKVFTEAFAIQGDGLKYTWDAEKNGSRVTQAAMVDMSATFYTGAVKSPVTLHPSAWPEVLEDVEILSFVFYKEIDH
jgi:hypothetical protein